MSLTGPGWAGLGWAGLGWAGLGWAGLGWAGLGWAGLGWMRSEPTESTHSLTTASACGTERYSEDELIDLMFEMSMLATALACGTDHCTRVKEY